jgi:uncharacterized membrane protein YccC
LDWATTRGPGLAGCLDPAYRAGTVAAAKKKPPIDARDIVVNDRALLGVLSDLAEQIKANDARYASRAERLDEVLAETAKTSARAEERSAQAEERSAQAEERSARAEEMAAVALQSIASLLQDLRALTQRSDASNARVEGRLEALENAAE